MAVNELNVTKVFPSSPAQEKAQTRAYVETPVSNSSSESRSAGQDVLKQFQANLNTLEDLNGRLRFVMHEIRGLIRK